MRGPETETETERRREGVVGKLCFEPSLQSQDCARHIFILNTVIRFTFSCGSDNDTARFFKAGRALGKHLGPEDAHLDPHGLLWATPLGLPKLSLARFIFYYFYFF